MKGLLANACGLTDHEIDPFLFDHSDKQAIKHLFSVAASLDSMVIGETQILAQVKQAYQLATDVKNSIPLTASVISIGDPGSQARFQRNGSPQQSRQYPQYRYR